MKRVKSECNCINLRRATNSLTKYYDNILKPCGLTTNQLSLMRNMKKLGVCSVSDLAEFIGLERTTLVRTLKPLFEKELIEDISSVGTRNRQIRVTTTGYEVIENGILLWEKAQNGVKEKIGEENVDVLMHILSLIEEL